MRLFMLLLCLFGQVNVIWEDLQFRTVVAENIYIHDASNSFSERNCDLSALDLSLIFLCFCAAYIAYQRRKTNRILRGKLVWMKSQCKYQDHLVGNLQTFLEDSRSKNSGLEMPLRKLNRKFDFLEQDIRKQINDLEGLSSQFIEFRNNWSEQAAPYIQIPEAELLAKMKYIKVKTELDMLREYIDHELEVVRSFVNDNKALLDEAAEDVDRLFISEGM